MTLSESSIEKWPFWHFIRFDSKFYQKRLDLCFCIELNALFQLINDFRPHFGRVKPGHNMGMIVEGQLYIDHGHRYVIQSKRYVLNLRIFETGSRVGCRFCYCIWVQVIFKSQSLSHQNSLSFSLVSIFGLSLLSLIEVVHVAEVWKWPAVDDVVAGVDDVRVVNKVSSSESAGKSSSMGTQPTVVDISRMGMAGTVVNSS